MRMGSELSRTAKFALTLVFASVAGATVSAYAQETKVTIVVPNPSAINNFALHVAIGEGYFKEQGLDVTVEAVNGSASVLQSMAAGQAQIGNPGPGPLLGARARGEDVVFIYNQFPKSIFGLVVKEDSKIQGPADIKGTTVGVGTADGAEVGFSRAILSKAGLTEGTDYQFLAVGDGGTAAAAFLNNEVNSYAAAVSDAAIIGSRGIPLREITPTEFLSFFGNGWAVTRSLSRSEPESHRRLRQGAGQGNEVRPGSGQQGCRACSCSGRQPAGRRGQGVRVSASDGNSGPHHSARRVERLRLPAAGALADVA